MPILKSFTMPPDMIDVFRKYPEGVWPLCEFHDVKLRGESPLSVGERELIAAYVSGVNACKYCYGAHRQFAEAQGIDSVVFEKLMADPAQAPIDPKLLPILAYVKKLTETPSRMTGKDAEAVYAAGWSERALYDAIIVCALFNFMNRLVDGCGITAKEALGGEMRKRMAELKDDPETYRNFARMVGATE
jgi:uncharacterized peroxidase-related enzyme